MRNLYDVCNHFTGQLVGRKVRRIKDGNVVVIREITIYSSGSPEVKLEGFYPNDTNSFQLHEFELIEQ